MKELIEGLIHRYPILCANRNSISKAFDVLKECFESGRKLLVVGNGGSASDAEHIVGELMKEFILSRKVSEEFAEKLREIDGEKGAELADKLQQALPVIALSNHNSLNTAFQNDVDGRLCFAQQVNGYGEAGDVLLAISTSGNSQNILYSVITAKAKGMKVIGLTGRGGGKLKELADEIIAVNESVTYKIQELHLPIYHCLCLMLEEYFWGTC